MGGALGVAQVVAHRGEGQAAGDDAGDTEEPGCGQPGGGRGGLAEQPRPPTRNSILAINDRISIPEYLYLYR